MPQEEPSKFQKLRDQIETWKNRAAMARQAGRDELVQQAMEHKRRYENELAKLQEFEEET
jgi:phage shock protein A